MIGRDYGSQRVDECGQVWPEICRQDCEPKERAAVLSEEGTCQET